ncbi:MAG: SCP2 sterol-binding domain-containing protein [Chloroflexi bacterium]|nr:SCP2 sterol-binding domain-containing protein [Chloroflexota bacterium]
MPASRTWAVCFRGVTAPELVEVAVSAHVDFTSEYDDESKTLRITAVAIHPFEPLTIELAQPVLAPDRRVLESCQKLVAAFRMESYTKQRLFNDLPNLVENPAGLVAYELLLTAAQLRALAEVLNGAGYQRSSTRRSQEEALVVWNNQERAEVMFKLAALDANGGAVSKRERLPKFGVFTIGDRLMRWHEGSQLAAGAVTVAAWLDSLVAQVRRLPATPETLVVQFDVAGENGRVAYLSRSDDEVVIINGRYPHPTVTISAHADDWLSLLNGSASLELLFLEGKIGVQGNLELALQLAESINLSSPWCVSGIALSPGN